MAESLFIEANLVILIPSAKKIYFVVSHQNWIICKEGKHDSEIQIYHEKHNISFFFY